MTIKKYVFSIMMIVSSLCSTSKAMSPALYGGYEKKIWALLKPVTENKATLKDVQDAESGLIKIEQAEAKKRIVNRRTQELRKVFNEAKKFFEDNQRAKALKAKPVIAPQVPVMPAAPCIIQSTPIQPEAIPVQQAPSVQAAPIEPEAIPVQQAPSPVQPVQQPQQKEREEKIRQEPIIDFAAIDALIAKLKANILAVKSKVIASAIDQELLPSAEQQLNRIKPDLAHLKRLFADPVIAPALKNRKRHVADLEKQFNDLVQELA